jgi:hypothetical protein
MSEKRPLLAFMGHHKCATRWINGVLRPVCRELGLRRAVVWNHAMFDGDLPAYVAQSKIDFLAYTNADYECVRQLPAVRGFHVVRDPRDICVSAYFSHRYSHETKHWPELVEHRQQLERLSFDEGLLLDMKFVENHFQEMYCWNYEDPNFLQVKMERLTADPYRQFLKIFDFLGILDERRMTGRYWLAHGLSRRLQRWSGGRLTLNGHGQRLPAEKLLAIVWQNEFDRKSGGRRPGQEDKASHYRKGKPGDWRAHFQPEHIRYFKEQYNPLLLKLGYESSADWT